jgi:heme-degrading monooxygenase HmoA
MAELVTTGYWRPAETQEDAFIAAWTDFVQWAAEQEGCGTLRLCRDLGNPGYFVSVATWRDADAAHAWKSSPEFAERMKRVQEHVVEFRPAELEVVAAVEPRAAVQPS